ncbi:MAG: Hypothetical protein AJITA_00977 [Acetilactobacillus jinshanensis]
MNRHLKQLVKDQADFKFDESKIEIFGLCPQCQKPTWRRNLYVLLPGTFFTSIAFCEFFPFMNLYINDLGNFTSGQISILSGIVYAITSLIVMFTAPFWGHFADQHGRKWMILQTSLGSAISIALMGLCNNAWEFIALRALQGFFGGVIPNSTALIGTEVPKKHSQYILSIFSIGYTSGGLIGPLIGGILNHFFSIRDTFLITGLIGWVLITTVLVQVSINTVYPIMSLFVKQLMHNHGPISIVAGAITSIPGIFDVMFSPICGKLGDKYGPLTESVTPPSSRRSRRYYLKALRLKIPGWPLA